MAVKAEKFQLSTAVKQTLQARKGIVAQIQTKTTELQRLKQMVGMTDEFLFNAAKEMPNEIAQQES